MITFTESCERAKKRMKGLGFLDGFTGIRETDAFWLFFGRYTPGNATEYGNNPIRVNKNTGECDQFLIFAPGNIRFMKNANPVIVPEEYRFKNEVIID